MDTASKDYAGTNRPPADGILGGIAGAFHSLRQVFAGLFRLFALEVRRAGLTLVWMVALGAIAAMLVVAAWLSLLGAAAFWAVSLGATWTGVLLVMALANLLVAATSVLVCMAMSRDLLFPSTRRQLEVPPARPDAA